MKECICYQADKLLKLLGGNFRIIRINTEINESYSEPRNIKQFYITNKENIREINESYGLSLDVCIYTTDGERLGMSYDKVCKNNFFSPSFEMKGDYVLANGDLNKWLRYNIIHQDKLKHIEEKIRLYLTYIYKGIGNPVIKNGKSCGYYKNILKISEKEIDNALADIKDVEIRYKIEAIVKSSASDHKYE